MEYETIRLMPTRKGYGYKLVVQKKWYYASKKSVHEMIKGERTAAVFSELDDKKNPASPYGNDYDVELMDSTHLNNSGGGEE